MTVSGVTKIFNCDTDAMDGGAGLLDTDLFGEGAGSLKLKVSNSTSAIVKYDQGAATGIDITGKHFGFLGFVAGAFDTRANAGVCIYLEDINGNYVLFYVGGNDTSNPSYNGFQTYTVYSGATAQETSGTYDPSVHRYMGMRFKTTSKAIKENVWFDNMFMFDELVVTSTSTEAVTCKNLADWDAISTNRYGLFYEALKDTYISRTGIIWGSTTAGLHIDFVDTKSKVNFEANYVGTGTTNSNRSSTLYKWKIQGNSTGTINYTSGAKSGSSGIQGISITDLSSSSHCTIEMNDSNIDKLLIYGGAFDNVGQIDLPNLTGTNYESLSTVFESHGDIVHRGFKIDGNWSSINAKDNGFLFTSNTHLIKNGTVINPTNNGWTTNQSGTISMEGITFSGTNGTTNYDIENTNASALTVNVVDNSSNVQYKNENPGTITISNPVSFKFTVSPSITGYEWRIYEVTALGSLVGAVEKDGEETATADNQTYNYTYTGDKFIAVQIISQPDEDYEEKIDYYTLKTSNQDVPIVLTKDNNN